MIAAGLLATGVPSPARADIYQRVQAAYEQYGSVPPCKFTSAQLETTLKAVDTYGAQYFADFTDAVQAALTARASGQCSPRSASGSQRTHPGALAPGRLPSSPTSPTGASVPGTILLMGALALLTGVLGTLLWLLRLSGTEPRWLAASRHAVAEAGYRLAAGWQDGLDAWRSLRARR